MRITRWAMIATLAAAAPAAAQTPREMLVGAAFSPGDKPSALVKIGAALRAAEATLARTPGDREAAFQRAVAISYRGKLKRNRHDIAVARRAFESLAAAHPRDAEIQMAVAGWHLGAVIEIGPLLARTALGARKATGMAALDRSIALGRGRALFPAFASLNRIQLDPGDIAGARVLAEAAVKARVATPVDRIMQGRAAQLLPTLRPGNGRAAAALAARLLPFGRFEK